MYNESGPSSSRPLVAPRVDDEMAWRTTFSSVEVWTVGAGGRGKMRGVEGGAYLVKVYLDRFHCSVFLLSSSCSWSRAWRRVSSPSQCRNFVSEI